ncbi:MAG TPA: LuxR C-terminal-related transcriptional regulator [Polyangiaceae bacterium]|nr:LuxR C-terminal-related transcriptional regulator [Polyangiaceae bacterium]
MRSNHLDVLRVVEAAYELDSTNEEWLKSIAEAVRPHLDDGFGLAAFEFMRVGDEVPTVLQSQHLWMPESLAQVYPRMFASMPPELRLRPFRLGPCITGSEMMNMKEDFANLPQMKNGLQKFGMFDSIWITATDPTGRGCGFHAGRKAIAWAGPAEKQTWGQIAAHLASAIRLRYRLRQAEAREPLAAVFEPNGKLHDAVGEAQETEARALLRDAVLRIERARGQQRHEAPEQALREWKALVAGKWSLVDRVEHDGRRYIVARENEPRAPGPAALSERERQILGYAQLGHHNKLIAYELGIAQSTVRVLMSRAMSKLGVRTREELLETIRQVPLQP